jgi:hypothetical protein
VDNLWIGSGGATFIHGTHKAGVRLSSNLLPVEKLDVFPGVDPSGRKPGTLSRVFNKG